MSDVTVVVPWRGGCPHREAARAWVLDRYRVAHPTWRVVIGEHPGPGPWVKAHAVAEALAHVDSPLVVVADADVWCDGLTFAVNAVRYGAAGWAVPHRLVRRFGPDATTRVLTGTLDPADVPRRDLAERPYEGYAGGGITVIPAGTLDDVPLDPRFAGWGQEDLAWSHALHALVGAPWRGDRDLHHLWHPPQPRANRVKGSQEGWQLAGRYRRARRDPTAMRGLLDEFVGVTA